MNDHGGVLLVGLGQSAVVCAHWKEACRGGLAWFVGFCRGAKRLAL